MIRSMVMVLTDIFVFPKQVSAFVLHKTHSYFKTIILIQQHLHRFLPIRSLEEVGSFTPACDRHQLGLHFAGEGHIHRLSYLFVVHKL